MTNTKKRKFKPKRRRNRRKVVKFAAKPSIMYHNMEDEGSNNREEEPVEETNSEELITRNQHWENVVLNYLNRLKGLCGLWRRNDAKIICSQQDYDTGQNMDAASQSIEEISINDDCVSGTDHGRSVSSFPSTVYNKAPARFECTSELDLPLSNQGSEYQNSVGLSQSNNEIEIGKERAIKIVKSAIEYGLASGVLQQSGPQFSFSRDASDFLYKNSLSLNRFRIRNLSKTNLSKNYKLARTLHPKCYCFKAFQNILQNVGSEDMLIDKCIQCSLDVNEIMQVNNFNSIANEQSQSGLIMTPKNGTSSRALGGHCMSTHHQPCPQSVCKMTALDTEPQCDSKGLLDSFTTILSRGSQQTKGTRDTEEDDEDDDDKF